MEEYNENRHFPISCPSFSVFTVIVGLSVVVTLLKRTTLKELLGLFQIVIVVEQESYSTIQCSHPLSDDFTG